jgi:membrane associated rhomboid family serine protease
MARRPSYSYGSSVAFGPGPLSQAMKVLIGANVALFLVQFVLPVITDLLGLEPAAVVGRFEIWRLGTYMFLHSPGDPFHILFNMLALWMFGTELERTWGTRYFLKYYFVTGIGAAVLTVVFSLLPLGFAQRIYASNVIGASGAIYGLLLAYGLYFPDRIILLILFPIPAKYFVMIMGLVAFFMVGTSNGVANATHLGGLLVGYLYLKSARLRPLEDAKYWYLRWRLYRTRKKFGVYSGGRANDWDRRVH